MAEPAATAAVAPAVVVPAAPVLHRKCGCGAHTHGAVQCSECAQRPDAAAAVLLAARTAGQPLEPSMRTWLEPAFGRDFSAVRVHVDAQAARAARGIGAAAYTRGNDIVFGAGSYRPHTAAGAQLVAHELAHVAQYAAFGAPSAARAPLLGHTDDPAEREADLAAQQAMRGRATRMAQPPRAGVHRTTADDWNTAGYVGGAIAGAGLLGLGIAWLAGAFDRSVFSPQELNQYLDVLARTRAIEDHRDSDNKARDLVRRWAAGETAFHLEDGHRTTGGALSGVELKRLLILEMLSGVTGSEDAQAILTVLESSPANELLLLFDPLYGLSVQDIDRKVGGDEHQRFERLLESRFPRSGADAARQRQDTGPTCTARQGLMVDYARQSALEIVNNAITMLSTQAGSDHVRQALDCRFHGATPEQLAQIRQVFARVRAVLPQRIYHCGNEGGAAEMEGMTVRDSTGARTTIPCVSELAVTFGNGEGSTIREVFLCPDFFRQSPEGQAVTVLHESVHMAGILDDIQYQPGCGMNLANALRNPDSYAYLANDLIASVASANPAPGSTTPGPALPQVTVGHFRNSGGLSEENHCPVCGNLPGLGLDANTFLNIMEVRGDIDQQRRGVQYDFKRTKERAIWRLSAGQWELLQYDPPGTDDDRTERDESLNPVNNHIYAIDGPGLQDIDRPGPGADTADEFVYKASFVEFVHARGRNGAWTPVSNEFRWHSVTWVEKVNGGWRRKQGYNEIEAGAISIGTALPIGPVDDVPLSPPGTAVA
jgi:hypothetical protein